MTVKKHHVAAASLLCAVVAALFIVIAYRGSVFSGNPLIRTLPFFHPNGVTAASDGSYAVVDSAGRRLLVAGPDNVLRYAVEKAGHKAGTMPVYSALGFYGSSLVVLDSATNMEDAGTETQNLLLLSPRGRVERVLYSRSYSKEERSDFTYSFYFAQLRGSMVYFFEPTAPLLYRFTEVSLTGVKTAFETDELDVSTYVGCAVVSPQEVYFLDQGGDIYAWTGRGEPALFRKNDASARIILPLSMDIDDNGNLLVLDGKRALWKVTRDSASPISLAAAAKSSAGGKVSFSSFSAGPQGTLAAPEEISASVFFMDAAGNARVVTKLVLPVLVRLSRAAVLLCMILGAAAFIVLCFVVQRGFFGGRMSLLAKQLLIFIPFIVAAMSVVSVRLYLDTHRNLEKETQRRLLGMSQMGSNAIDAEAVDTLDVNGLQLLDFLGSPQYKYLDAFLMGIVNDNQDWWNSTTYAYIYKKIDGAWYAVGPYDYIELYPYDWPQFDAVLSEGNAELIDYSDVWGRWYSGITPVKTKDGRIVAIFEVTMNNAIFEEFDKSFAVQVAWGVAGAATVLMLVFALYSYIVLRSLRKLTTQAIAIKSGNYDAEVRIRSHDELADLSEAFNTMSREIKARMGEITRLNEANARFVPNEFLSFLGKQSIVDVKLGDQTRQEMAVMFTDIRSFTRISEVLSPERTFTLLNAHLADVGPVVREFGGFIDKYVGDSIIALFPRNPKGAIDAALRIQNRVEAFNLKLSEECDCAVPDGLRIGIGVHTGMLMLGVIGEERRYDGTVIADAVNVAARLEGLSKQYGVSIVVSEDMLRGVGDTATYEKRFLDRVRLLGKFEPLSVYEIIMPTDPARKHKLETRTVFSTAYQMYREKRFKEAQELFTKIARRCPDDYASILFMRRCARLEREGTPPEWDGVLELRDK